MVFRWFLAVVVSTFVSSYAYGMEENRDKLERAVQMACTAIEAYQYLELPLGPNINTHLHLPNNEDHQGNVIAHHDDIPTETAGHTLIINKNSVSRAVSGTLYPWTDEVYDSYGKCSQVHFSPGRYKNIECGEMERDGYEISKSCLNTTCPTSLNQELTLCCCEPKG